MQDRFTSHEVIRLTGISPRQPEWWDERGVVGPDRAGRRRLYSLNQISGMGVICELRRKGFSLEGVRKVMRFLDREFGKGLAEVMSHDSELHLPSDGKHLYLETEARHIVDILKKLWPADSGCLPERRRTAGAGRVVCAKANTSVTTAHYRKHARKVS
jgi:DNA-binding transcriptional MerR regulator